MGQRMATLKRTMIVGAVVVAMALGPASAGVAAAAPTSGVNNHGIDHHQVKCNPCESISIGDMFEMQMLMNHLSQLSDMARSVISAANSALKTHATNVRG
jgi:hypothetical protein